MKLSKTLPAGLFLAFILFSSSLSPFADPQRSDAEPRREEGARLMNLVLFDANEYLREQYGGVLPALQSGDYYPPSVRVGTKTHRANHSLYQRYKLIIYWSGEDLKEINPGKNDRLTALAGDPFYAEGEPVYRYLGYDLEGKKLHNPQFPSDSYEKNPRYTLKEPAKKAFWKQIIAKDAALRDRILANFNKSWLEEIDALIEVYFKYRSLPQGADREVYKKNHRRHIAKLIRERQVDARHINLISLPTDRIDGLAEYENSYNFYKAIVLRYQNDSEQKLEIRHLIVEVSPEKPGAYRVSERLSGIRESRDLHRIGLGETKSVSAKHSKYFSCLGYRIFQSEEDFLRELGGEGGRKPFEQFVKAETLVYRYDPSSVNEKPIAVFFYLKNENEIEDAEGHIEVSSKDYEVSRAIPSDEKVKIRAYADRAVLAAYDAELREEELSIDLCFVQTLLVEDEKGRKKRERVEERLETLTRSYSVYELNYYQVFHLKEATVENEKLQRLFPIRIPCREIGRSEARVYADHLAKIEIPQSLQGRRLSLGYGKEEGEAPYKIRIHLKEDQDDYLTSSEVDAIVSDLEREMKIEVRNDFLQIDGEIVLSDQPSEADRIPAPKPYPGRRIVLEKPAQLIDARTRNGRAETVGTLVYEKILDSEEENEEARIVPIFGNEVSVHTPAGNRTVLKREDAFDQRSEEKKKGLAVPLDHIMELEILSDVQHIDEKGYGLRDYQKHLKGKSLRLGFDAYVSLRREDLEETLPEARFFVRAGRALHFSPEKKRVYYKAAPWVKEGVYSITGTSLAKNALLPPAAEKGANLHPEHDAAFDGHRVQVAGRLFDFALERIFDPAFLSGAAGDFYSSGSKNKESLPRRRFAAKPEAAIERRILPVSAGKAAGSPRLNRDVKMGYPFVFSVKSMGSYYAKEDLLSLKPHFYHLEGGRINERIALYYKSGSKLLPLDASGFAKSAVYRDLLLPREMPELIYSRDLLKEAAGRYGSMDYEEYTHRSAEPVFCYEPKLIVLSAPFRTFIGPDRRIPEEIDATLAKMSVQRWRGIYSLPSSTRVFALDEAGKPDLKKPLTKGSLGIYFEIGLARDRNLSGFDLCFVNQTANQYLNEGYRERQGGENYLTGTAILYSLEHRADEDWKEE